MVYKIDRLTRSLADFVRIVELFDRHCVSFVSVTQAFNTTSSMGRLTLNVLLSFAQFEREVKRGLEGDGAAARDERRLLRLQRPATASTPLSANAPESAPPVCSDSPVATGSSEPKVSVHSSNGRLLVIRVAPRS